MSVAAMIRLLRARETYGFVRGRLDSTREVRDWSMRALFVSISAIIALVVATFRGFNTLPALPAVVAAAVGLTALVRYLSRLQRVLSGSIKEAQAECLEALVEFDRENIERHGGE